MSTLIVLGSATNPAGGGVVATTGTLSQGHYQVTVTAQLSGTIAAGDLNNMQLQVGATVIGPLLTLNPAAAGNGPPVTAFVDVPAAGAAITVNATGAASGASAVYKAQIAYTLP